MIPDPQVKPGADLRFLKAIGNYIVAKKPDTVICLGDFADMPSLSSYDKGKKSFEGRRYKADIKSAHIGQETLLGPLWADQKDSKRRKKRPYRPRLVMLGGNHDEGRINRAIEEDSILEGTIGLDDLKYEQYGWEYQPFLKPLAIDGVIYAHYLTSGVMGRPITTAQALLSKKHMSAVVGHQQGLQFHSSSRADGKSITGIIAGSSYPWDEDYLDPQSNKHWRGILVLHEVDDGDFTFLPVSTNYLLKNYLKPKRRRK